MEKITDYIPIMDLHSSTPARVNEWLHSNGFADIKATVPVSGGCINDCFRLDLADGKQLFLKQYLQPPPHFFEAEAQGLKALANKSPLRVPNVIHADSSFILLEYIAQSEKQDKYWENLGTGLAILHENSMPSFGFPDDNYCGSSPQHNPVTHDGHRFFANHRLLFQVRLALQNNLLHSTEIAAIETLVSRLKQLLPEQPPVLLHGDLWSGNIHVGSNVDNTGEPVLIDPAAYWGWAETDLAMTALFGGFPDRFYHSYEEYSSIDLQWRERADLYNLYHLLNHLNLFGRSYFAQIQAIIQKYA